LIEFDERQRILAWEGCLNARDLGGYPTVDGRQTRWGAFTRSDSLTPLTAAGRQAVIDYGIRTIIDLRTPQETVDQPNPFARGDWGINYINISFVDPAGDIPSSEFESLVDDYLWMLGQFAANVGQVMSTIARAPEGGILIHCMGGKDRTGLISAFLLDLAGVPREIIAEDYGLTAELLRPRDEKWLAGDPEKRAEREALLRKFAPRPEAMREVLARLDEKHGSVERYLLAAGATTAEIHRIRDRLV